LLFYFAFFSDETNLIEVRPAKIRINIRKLSF